MAAVGFVFAAPGYRKAMKHKTIEPIEHSLEVDEELDLQKKGWVVQRIGWVFMFLFVALAALGLFGEGVLSKQKAEAAGAAINYERFFRHESRMELKVEIGATDSAIVSFPNEYLDKFRIESVTPEPKDNEVASGRIRYHFSGQAPMKITFYLVPQQVGTISGDVAVNGHQFKLSHFIYP